MSDQDLSKLKVAELRELLKSKGLNSVGNKQELIDRLQSSHADSSGVLDEDDLLNDDELDEEKSLLDSTHDEMLKSPSESNKSTSPEVVVAPTKPISLKRNISVTVPVVESKSTTESPAAATPDHSSSDEPDKKVVKISELSAQERLEMRAKKFAITSGSAPGDSQDKLQARAARFGISAPAATPKTTVAPTGANLEVLKKRAERFGVVTVPELKKDELDEKLLKRQERFGATGKTLITAPSSAKDEMSEKALKRLERFKQTA